MTVENTPIVKVRRSSIWDDYARGRSSGEGKELTVLARSHLLLVAAFWGMSGPAGKMITPPLPNVKVWGSGGGDPDDPDSEVNATSNCTWWMTLHRIIIMNQGKGFEPNGTSGEYYSTRLRPICILEL